MARKFLVLLLCLNAGIVKPQEAVTALVPIPGLSDTQLDLIHEQTKIFADNTQLAIALIDGQKTLFYGLERRNDSLFTINNSEALFEIGSITKVFTATLLAHEVVNGNLTLDQKVSDILKMTFHTGNDMTLEELASHTSGMPRLAGNLFTYVKDQTNPYKEYSPEILINYLKDEFEVLDKKEYAYSNTGAALLGYSLAVYNDRPYTELIQDNILTPLGMKSAVFGAANAGDRLVPALNPQGNPTSNWDMNVHAPAGGLICSVSDLEKFARAQFDPNNKAMALSRQETSTIREDTAVCLGWHVRNLEEGRWYSHSGGTGGYRSVMVVDIENHKAVILLSNVSGFHIQSNKVEQLGAKLMKSLY